MNNRVCDDKDNFLLDVINWQSKRPIHIQISKLCTGPNLASIVAKPVFIACLYITRANSTYLRSFKY